MAAPDVYAYTAIKDPVVDLVMTVAEAWALEKRLDAVMTRYRDAIRDG